MSHDEHHIHLMEEVAEIFEPIFSKSSQAIYIYLDDTHKTCNQKFADLLDYSSIDEWIANEAPVEDIIEADQDKVIEAYGAASEKYEASCVSVSAKTKGGSEIEIDVTMVPFTYKNEVFVIHYITQA